MAEVNEEQETAVVAVVTSPAKVLYIGDNDAYVKPTQTKEVQNYDKANLKADFKSYLTLLLFGTRTDIPVKEDWHSMDLFEMKMIETKENEPKRCRFYCHRGGKYENYHCKHNGNTVNAEHVMHEVRKKLKDENWKSKYELELPLKAEIGNKQYHDEEYYLSGVYMDAVCEIEKKMFRYIYYLHKEYVKEKALKFT